MKTIRSKMNMGSLITQQAYSERTKDKKGKEDFSANYLRLPKDVKVLKLEAKKVYNLRIVPYMVDKNHPLVINRTMKEGDAAYTLAYEIHCNLGVNETSLLCPRTYGRREECPVCQQVKDFYDEDTDESKKKARSIKAKRRNLYNVIDLKHPEDGVQLLDVSQFIFEKALLDACEHIEGEEDDYDDGDTPTDIIQLCVGGTDPSEAKYMKIKTTEATIEGSKNPFVKCTFSFKPCQADQIHEEALDSAIPLQDLLIRASVQELKDTLYGVTSSQKDDEDEDEDEDEDVIEESDSDEEDDDSKPLNSIDEEDEEDEEEEALKSRPKAKTQVQGPAQKCPNGYNFPMDAMKKEECDDCKIYEDCIAAKKALKRAQAGK